MKDDSNVIDTPCPYDELIPEYVGGLLPAKVQEIVRAHVDQC